MIFNTEKTILTVSFDQLNTVFANEKMKPDMRGKKQQRDVWMIQDDSSFNVWAIQLSDVLMKITHKGASAKVPA